MVLWMLLLLLIYVLRQQCCILVTSPFWVKNMQAHELLTNLMKHYQVKEENLSTSSSSAQSSLSVATVIVDPGWGGQGDRSMPLVSWAPISSRPGRYYIDSMYSTFSKSQLPRDLVTNNRFSLFVPHNDSRVSSHVDWWLSHGVAH